MTTKTLKLKAGALIEDDDTPVPSRFAVLRATTDINQLPTWEILRRVYERHSVAIWASLCIGTWVGIIWNKLT